MQLTTDLLQSQVRVMIYQQACLYKHLNQLHATQVEMKQAAGTLQVIEELMKANFTLSKYHKVFESLVYSSPKICIKKLIILALKLLDNYPARCP